MMRALSTLIALLIVIATNACGPGEQERSVLESGKALYSQGKEELIIRDFFEDRRSGFFLDVGSYQWKKLSTTYYLEKHLGWCR